MKNRKNLFVVVFAFLFGQAIQLVTNALAHYLYVSDPVMLCITTAIITVALVVMTAVFTLMDTPNDKAEHTSARPGRRSTVTVPTIMNGMKPNLADIPPEDIDKIDIDLFEDAK